MMSKEKMLLATIVACVAGLVLVGYLFLGGDSSSESALDGEETLGARSAAGGGASLESEIDSDGRSAASKEKVEPAASSRSAGPGAARRSAGAGTIAGRVVNEFNVPLEGAAIEVSQEWIVDVGAVTVVGDVPEDEGATGPSCTSDERGLFVLEEVAAAGEVRIHLSHSDYVPRFVIISAFDGTRHDVGDVVLELGGSISGFITDETGKGLAGASVQARPVDAEGGSAFFDFSSIVRAGTDWKVTAGPNGFYTIRGLRPGKAHVFASHDDHPSAEAKNIAVARGEETGDIDIVLPWGEAIAGKVVNDEGEPLAGATVAATKDFDISLDNLGDLEGLPFDIVANLSPVETDAAGRFRLKGLAAGHYTVRASAKSYLRAERKKVEAGTDDLLLVARRGGSIVGRVVDATTGAGIESFEIEIDGEIWTDSDYEILTGAAAAARSTEPLDPGGAFFLKGLEPEAFDLLVRSGGYADERLSDLRVDPGEAISAKVELWPEAVLSGILVTADGAPVADGTIVLQSPPAEMPDAPDPADLAAASAVIPGIESLAGLAVAKWDKVKETESDAEGAFVFRGIGEGSFRLIGSHRMHADSEPVEVAVARGETKENLEIRLGLAGSIAGTVFAVDGTPRPGARIQVGKGGGLLGMIASDTRALDGDGADFLGLNSATSDGDGRFRIDGLTPGAYQVSLANPEDSESLGGILNSALSGLMGQGASGAVRVHVEGGEVAEVELHETLKGLITGVVREAGEPLSGMKVNLFKGDLGFLAIVPLKSTSTNRDGAYLFDALDAGNYDVRIDIKGHGEPMKEPVALDAGARARCDFDLSSGRVSGRVVDGETGRPLAGMRVSLKSNAAAKGGGLFDLLGVETSTINISVNDDDVDTSDGLLGLSGPSPVQTGSDGRFEIRFVADGEYTLTVSGKGYIKAEQSPVKVTAGSQREDLDFALDKGWTVSGRVALGATGAPVAFCTIRCERLVKGSTEPEKVKTFACGEEGEFTLPGLAPGTYRLKAREKGKEGEEMFIIETADVKGVEISLW